MKTRILELKHQKDGTYYLVQRKFLFFWITEKTSVHCAGGIDFVPRKFSDLESALEYKNRLSNATRRIINEAK